MNREEQLKEFVAKKHKGQKYNNFDYMYHIMKVVGVGEELLSQHPSFSTIKELLYCHDLKEDTDVTDEELLEFVSPMVLDWINRLTDKPGKNRKERHLNTYYLIREVEIAVLGKLCDRIANMRACIEFSSDKGKMYLKEADSFKMALFDPRHSYAKKLWKVYDEEISKLKNIFWKKREKPIKKT